MSLSPEPGPPEEPLRLRIEPQGPAAERVVAELHQAGAATREVDAAIGQPVATGRFHTGEAALDTLVLAAEFALGEVDLKLTLDRP